jgi:ectoine hydroxylase-related dioxygenase (phytanoyl-CoA dioxygenase family)
MPPSLERSLVPMVVPAGACIFFHGTLMHRGGANRSAAPRLALSNQYCEPWARTQENF